MKPSILVLGPARWRDDRRTPFLTDSPLECRRALARQMRKEGARTILMEDEPKSEEEDNFQLFERLVHDQAVSTFVLFWTLGARLHGLDVEIGYLLGRLGEGTLDAGDIYLLAEKRLLAVHSREATLAWSEPGNRTRYHEDLVARGCPIRRWSTESALRAHAGAIALEHLGRS